MRFSRNISSLITSSIRDCLFLCRMNNCIHNYTCWTVYETKDIHSLYNKICFYLQHAPCIYESLYSERRDVTLASEAVEKTEKHKTETMRINIVSRREPYSTGWEQCVKVFSVVFSGSEACLPKEMKGLSACVIQSGWVLSSSPYSDDSHCRLHAQFDISAHISIFWMTVHLSWM